MSQISSHTELAVFICLGIGCLLIFAFFQYKSKSSVAKTLRRLLFLLIALVGIGLLTLRPVQTLETDKQRALVEATHITDEHTYSSIHELLAHRAELYGEIQLDPIHTNLADLEIGAKQFSVKPSVDSSSWGITDLSIPNRIVENEPWQLSGYTSIGTSRISIKNQLSDKSTSSGVEDGQFTLTTSSPFAGHQLYDLIAYDKLGDSISYTIPVEVVTDEPWQLMALTSFPSFELNALKNFWVDEGNGFFWRSSVSTGRYRTSSVNTSVSELNTVNRQVLRSFDFLLIDIPTWNQLNAQERKTINGQVSTQGLGLMLIPTDVNQQAVDVNHPSIINYDENQESSPASQYSFGSGWQNIRSGSGTYGRYQDYGLGRRLILSHDKTYQHVLADQDDQYDRIWSSILSVAFNSYQSTSKILTEQWVWAGEHTDLYLITDQPISGDILLNDSVKIEPIPNPHIDHTYQLTLWPEPEYNTLSFNDEQLRFYAHHATDWPMVRLQQQAKALALTESQEITDKHEYNEPYPPFYGLVLVIIGLGLLWIDERLYS